jgi:hypothetical protein
VLTEHVCGGGFPDLPTAKPVAAGEDILDTFGCLLWRPAGAPGVNCIGCITGKAFGGFCFHLLSAYACQEDVSFLLARDSVA